MQNNKFFFTRLQYESGDWDVDQRMPSNVLNSLIEYTKLVEQRQISELREYVSKLSAKMTVVMMVFLFPALLIFVAGPGFVGLANALKGL